VGNPNAAPARTYHATSHDTSSQILAKSPSSRRTCSCAVP